jgi:hypothetical protein
LRRQSSSLRPARQTTFRDGRQRLRDSRPGRQGWWRGSFWLARRLSTQALAPGVILADASTGAAADRDCRPPMEERPIEDTWCTCLDCDDRWEVEPLEPINPAPRAEGRRARFPRSGLPGSSLRAAPLELRQYLHRCPHLAEELSHVAERAHVPTSYDVRHRRHTTSWSFSAGGACRGAEPEGDQ